VEYHVYPDAAWPRAGLIFSLSYKIGRSWLVYKILVPVDGTDHSMKALHIACDLADKYKARIILLHILTKGKKAQDILDLAISGMLDPKLKVELRNLADKGSDPLSIGLLKEIGKNILEIATGKVHRGGLETEVLAIAEGNAAENILIAHKLVAASTIVMGSRGIRGSTPEEASVSHTVFAKAECTCISVK
jgi:nucleotide-binding universal stress UspA family protein